MCRRCRGPSACPGGFRAQSGAAFPVNAGAEEDLPAANEMGRCPAADDPSPAARMGRGDPARPVARRSRPHRGTRPATAAIRRGVAASRSGPRPPRDRPRIRLSELGELDTHAFGLFLGLLGEALTEQAGPDASVERATGDGCWHVRLVPLGAGSRAEIVTPNGVFAGRDHLITITPGQGG